MKFCHFSRRNKQLDKFDFKLQFFNLMVIKTEHFEMLGWYSRAVKTSCILRYYYMQNLCLNVLLKLVLSYKTCILSSEDHSKPRWVSVVYIRMKSGLTAHAWCALRKLDMLQVCVLFPFNLLQLQLYINALYGCEYFVTLMEDFSWCEYLTQQVCIYLQSSWITEKRWIVNIY